MRIEVLGRGCAKCNLTAELIQEVTREAGLSCDIKKVFRLKEIAVYGVFITPAVVIDGIVRCSGRIPSKDEILQWLSPSP